MLSFGRIPSPNWKNCFNPNFQRSKSRYISVNLYFCVSEILQKFYTSHIVSPMVSITRTKMDEYEPQTIEQWKHSLTVLHASLNQQETITTKLIHLRSTLLGKILFCFKSKRALRKACRMQEYDNDIKPLKFSKFV